MNSIGCKFCPPATRFRGSDDVINSKFSHFPAESAGLHSNGSGTQTKAARSNFQKKREMRIEILYLPYVLKFDLRSVV